MHLASLADWLTWGGLVVTLGALGWSGWRYTGLKREELQQRQFENFFATMLRVHNADGSLLSQKAAVFEIRHYARYKDVTLSICENPAEYFGSTIDNRLAVEFDETANYLRKIKGPR